MKNTLKIVLMITGFLLISYGLYVLISPRASVESGPLQVEAQEDNSQTFAMIGLGVLALLGGLAFNKK